MLDLPPTMISREMNREPLKGHEERGPARVASHADRRNLRTQRLAPDRDRIRVAGAAAVAALAGAYLLRPELVQWVGEPRFDGIKPLDVFEVDNVEIFDYGRTEDGTYYYVMEYLPGMSLGDLVERYGPLPPGRAVYLLRQVALALQEAHEAGLIHRDIKPSNIFAARRGGMDDVAKLLDFGLVRPAATASSPRTSDEGQILGTPLYMSPEQATNSRPLDARSDIYSLGAVAYYLLTGRPPFDAGNAIEAIIAHARDPVVPASQIRDEVPADLDAVVLRCLAKDPMERFPDAESLEIALGRCACASSWDKALARQWWNDVKLLR